MPDIVYKITLTLRGPILSQSSAAGALGVDAPMARDSNNHFCLPGTLVKGKLLEALMELRSAGSGKFNPDIEQLFGKKTAHRKDNPKAAIEASRARLTLSDFRFTGGGRDGQRNRIRMDPHIGSVAKGAYLVMEAPFDPGEEAEFTGEIRFFAANEQDRLDVKRYIEAGLHWTGSFGAERTIGFGRVLKVNVQDTAGPSESAFNIAALDDDGRLAVAISPKAPFCISQRRPNDNLFESESVIPGGAWKGALTSTWMDLIGKPLGTPVAAGVDPKRPALAKHFDRVRFTHAMPAPSSTGLRPSAIPQSVVQVMSMTGGRDQPRFYDLALSGPGTIGDRAPAFAIDWKYSDANTHEIQKAFGWYDSPSRELRVHTAMDSEKRRSKDEQLFAYETVIPDGFEWLGWIDFGLIEDQVERHQASAEMHELLSRGMRFFGKTKTAVDAATRMSHKVASPSASDPLPGKLWVVTLQTCALLANAGELNEFSGDEELRKAYENAWTDLSGGVLALQSFYAWQTLAGGFYLWRRFQDGSRYYPYLLTGEGSVFVLRSTEAGNKDAKELIEQWLAHGLPSPTWVKLSYAGGGHDGGHWTNCPYICENGYGEIAVNQACHTDQKPGDGVFNAI